MNNFELIIDGRCLSSLWFAVKYRTNRDFKAGMSRQTVKRVRIEEHDGVRVYSAGAWPGWAEVIGLVFVFVLFTAGLAFFLYGMRWIASVYQQAFDTFNVSWLGGVFAFLLGGLVDLTVIAGFAFVCVLIPYILLYDLSSKRFRIEGGMLFHTSYLLGFIPHTKRLRFDQVLDIEAQRSTGGYTLTVKYERDLPTWLFVILVFWNERLTQWAIRLVSGIPTQEEALALQAMLLEPLTKGKAFVP
jgi:hypothetical protein